ncbi:MAG: hypothetical protein RI981_246 [Bacteroidota bacterium]|jgi:type I restriction enzyme S subunit
MEVKQGFKETELGIIPEDWEVKKFFEVMDGFSSGQTPYRGIPEFYKGDIPWITSGELNYNVITDTIEKITPEGAKEANLKRIPKGTFLFAITGLEAAGTRGSCAITGIEATTNQSCMALYPKKDFLTTAYLYHYYVKYGNELALKYCQGTKQQSYTGGIAKKLPIIIPPTIKEQTAIANALSDMDALIAQTEKLIEKKKAIKQGVMQELLKPKEDWVTKTLGDIYFTLKGKNLGKSNLNHNGKYECILYGELFTTYDESIVEIKNRTNDLGVSSIYDDILFPGSTTTSGIDLAKCSVVLKNDIQLGGDIIVLRKQAIDVDSQFVAFYLNQFCKNEIAQSTRGITIHHLYGKDLIGIKIQLPTIVQQKSIATAIVDIRQEIKLIESKLQKLKLQKQGMMQTLLTGKIRLV